jgi:hypothetical protein
MLYSPICLCTVVVMSRRKPPSKLEVLALEELARRYLGESATVMVSGQALDRDGYELRAVLDIVRRYGHLPEGKRAFTVIRLNAQESPTGFSLVICRHDTA